MLEFNFGSIIPLKASSNLASKPNFKINVISNHQSQSMLCGVFAVFICTMVLIKQKKVDLFNNQHRRKCANRLKLINKSLNFRQLLAKYEKERKANERRMV